MGLYNYYFTELVDRGSYESESGVIYSALDFIEYAKGNMQYALALRERVDWENLGTVVEQDLIHEEIIEIEDQYIMTNGSDIEIFYNEQNTNNYD
jgi:Arc/MetJ-type ribon-helix-helix transcriptional regulator